jgi:hypothetical protein
VAAEQLLQSVSITSKSIVYFVGPVKPGTLIEEEYPFKGKQITRLEVPLGPGNYYVFYIDDGPEFKFAHSVRYAWANLETHEVRSAGAEWWPKVSEPGMLPLQFKPSSSGTLGNVRFVFGVRTAESTNK